MRSTRLLVVAGVVAVVGALPVQVARAASGTQVVSGTVTYSADGTPVVNGVVWSPDDPTGVTTHTDAAGNYSLTLSAGVHEVRTSTAGCTDPGDATVDLTLSDQTQNFSLAARPNDFGLACTSEPLAWVDATTVQTMRGNLTGTKVVSLRLRFLLAGTVYTSAKVTTAGQVLLHKLGGVDHLIEVLDLNLQKGGYPDSAVLTSTAGVKPNRMFTVEWRDWAPVNTPGEHMTYELQLHENGGAFDMLYQTTGPSQVYAPRAIEQTSGTSPAAPFILGPFANDSPPLDGMALHFAPSV
jgi:hypothetical protein